MTALPEFLRWAGPLLNPNGQVLYFKVEVFKNNAFNFCSLSVFFLGHEMARRA